MGKSTPKGPGDPGQDDPTGPKAGMGLESTYALLIGVGESRNPDWSLPVSVRDVNALRRALVDPQTCAYDPSGVAVLTNGTATRENIVEALAALSAATAESPDATVFFYYSGHGWRQADESGDHYYLVPHDVDTADFLGTAFPANELVLGLQSISARRLVVVIDTCHAEGMTASKTASFPKGFVSSEVVPKALVEELGSGNGRAVFLSCREEQKSWIFPGEESLSVFTHHLLEALNGAGSSPEDRVVKVTGLLRHLGDAVEASARRLGRVQRPFFKLEAEDFPVAYLNGGREVSGSEVANYNQSGQACEPAAGGIHIQSQEVSGDSMNVGEIHGNVKFGDRGQTQ